jgi:hypothetical protein
MQGDDAKNRPPFQGTGTGLPGTIAEVPPPGDVPGCPQLQATRRFFSGPTFDNLEPRIYI